MRSLLTTRTICAAIVACALFGFVLMECSASAMASFRTIKRSEMYLLMPINQVKADHSFCRCAKAAVVQGYRPILYNWDVSGDLRHLQGLKISGLLDFMVSHLQGKPSDTLVLSMDSLDVWLQLPPSTLVSRYHGMGHKIVIGADRYCWPNDWDSQPRRMQGINEANLASQNVDHDPEHNPNPDLSPDLFGPPRFANSGFVIGELIAMRRLFESLNTTLNTPGWPWETDQSAFNLHLNDADITLDYRLRLVWSNNADTTSGLIGAVSAHPDGSASADDVTPWHLYPSLFRHQHTGEVPVAVHFNMWGEKDNMDAVWPFVWWSGTRARFRDLIKSRLQGAELRIYRPERGLQAVPFESICQDV